MLVAALLLAPRPAEFPDTSQSGVSVAFRDCAKTPIGRAVFFGALALELPSMEQHEPQLGTEIAVALACDGTARIRIRVGTITEERTVRFDDVPGDQRARALALVVAELFRSAARESNASAGPAPASASSFEPDAAGSERPAKASESAPPKSVTERAPEPPKAAPASADNADAVNEAPAPGRTRAERAVSVLIGANARAVEGASVPLWGVDAGADLRIVRIMAELAMARSGVERGTITSGVAAARAGRGVDFANAGPVVLSAGASVAGGVTWSVGDSRVVGTTVREVLKPYFDLRLELTSRLELDTTFTPELSMYGGRAAGLSVESDGRVEQATGGFFGGIRFGAMFR